MRQLRNWMWAYVALAAICLARPPLAQDAFTGSWQVRCTPTSSTLALGAETFDDGFIFDEGQFSASAYMGLGFTPGAYSIDATGKMTITLSSADRGSVRWSGRVSGSTISGYITWTKPDGSVFKYRYTGSAVTNPNE